MDELNKADHDEFEVEVRACVHEADFKKTLDELTSLFGQPKIVEMKTFLFKNKDNYRRIRIFKNDAQAVLAEKIGTYADKARREISKNFDFNHLDDILSDLNKLGLNSCSFHRSIRYTFFTTDSQQIDLSKHEHLGNFLEIEILVAAASEIDGAFKKVNETISDFGLKAVTAEEYQLLMDQMYLQQLKPVSEYKNLICEF